LVASEFEKGRDFILCEAPVLLLFYADRATGYYASANAHVAVQNAALAAETLGLGCFYAGFVVLACDRDNSIPELLSLPRTHRIQGALALGYPLLNYRNWPERKPARIKWIGAN
jgi:nitroreductase